MHNSNYHPICKFLESLKLALITMQLYHPENILTTSPLVFSGSQKANKMLGIMWKDTETTTGHRFSTRKTWLGPHLDC